MDPSSIASAYLSSLIHSPGSHFISLEYRPSQQLTRSDLSVWMEGFRCACRGDIASLPANDEVFDWVDIALKRFFEWKDPLVEQAVAAQTTTVSDQTKTEAIKPEQGMAHSTNEEVVAAAERKKNKRSVSGPGLRLGLCGTLVASLELAFDLIPAAISSYQEVMRSAI